ncbi:MAG: flagellar protein FlgN [Planctomycetota bacterium]
MTTENSTTPNGDAGRIAGPVADHLLAHLHDEEASLVAMLQAVRDVHGALRHLNDDKLRQALEDEARVLKTAEGLQQRRSLLRSELSAVLGVSAEEVTLRRIVAATTGSLRETVEHCRQSLAEMAAEMNRLNRQNAAMIRQSLSITHGIIGRLTGTAAVGESYNADGGRDEAHVGSLVQWGG